MLQLKLVDIYVHWKKSAIVVATIFTQLFGLHLDVLYVAVGSIILWLHFYGWLNFNISSKYSFII